MASSPLTATEADSLLIELRAMALLAPGQNAAALDRARAIASRLRTLDPSPFAVGRRADSACKLIEILLSSRRWKTEAVSVDSLRKSIKSECDRLRVATEGALARRRTG